MSRKFFQIGIAASVFFAAIAGPAYCEQVTTSHEFTPIEWNFQGKPIPETHWSPWVPLLSQQIIRLKLGFRFSSGTIGAKCPVKLTFSYDNANAKSGRDMPIKVKAEMMSANYNTFESAFGISLPNKIQLGFFGISGLPDFLPWWDINYDFWDLVSMIPKVGDSIASAEDNIGVNTSSKEALPLSSTKSYHDQRTLISVDLSEIAEQYKTTLAPKLYNKLSSVLTHDEMDGLLTLIKTVKNLNDEGAVTFLTDLCGSAIEKLASFASISLSGDPYFSVEGIQLRINARCFIPGGKGSGNYVLYFTSSGQEQTINFRDITPFVENGDKLTIIVDEIMYEFKLRQGLTAKIGISLANVNLDNVEKVVSYTQAAKNYTESEFKLEIPLSPSDELIQGLRANPGCISASVNWASPIMPVKGTVKAYSGDKLIKTVTESSFKNAHNVIITDLTKSTTYRFEVQCVTSDGQICPVQSVETTTKDSYIDRVESASIKATNKYEAFNLTNPSATAGPDYIDFSWTTDQLSSTEVMISPSPDLSVNYVACVKKQDGTVVQGWVTREGERKLEKDHTMRVTVLEPGTLYYYNMKSWQFDNDDLAKPKFAVGKIDKISTTALPDPPTVKIKALYQNAPVPDIPVIITKVGDPSYRVALRTTQNGITPVVTLERNKVYSFSVSDHIYYQNVTSSPLNVSNTATGALPDLSLNLTAKASPGGNVLDSQGSPLAGATVKIVGQSGYQTVTDRTGHYTFDGFTTTGSVNVEVSKQNYVTKTFAGQVQLCSLAKLFSAPNCVLDSAIMTLNITLKKINGTAIPNTTIIIKEGNTQIGSITTNAQGVAVFTYNFNDNNANNHNLTILVQPAATSGIVAVTTTTSVIGGSTQNLEIDCPQDTSGPVISNLTITQQNDIAVINLNANEDGSFNVIYKEPGSNTELETIGGAFVKSGDIYVGHREIRFTKEGTYKIKIKATDRTENKTETNWTDLMFYTRAFTFSIGKSTNSMTFSWSRPWLDETQFAKYVLTIESPAKNIEITDRATTTYTLTGLGSNKLICGTFKVLSKTGTTLYEFNSGVGTTPKRFTISTDSVGAQVTSFTVKPNPAGTGQTIHAGVQMNDPDLIIQKFKLTAAAKVVDKTAPIPPAVMSYEQNAVYTGESSKQPVVSHDFTIDSAGTYSLTIIGLDYRNIEVLNQSIDLVVSAAMDPKMPKITLQLPQTGKAGEQLSGTIKLTSVGKEVQTLSFNIDWSKDEKEKIDLDASKMASFTQSKPLIPGTKDQYIEIYSGDVAITHTYQQAGNYNVTVTATAIFDKNTLVSEPASASINLGGDSTTKSETTNTSTTTSKAKSATTSTTTTTTTSNPPQVTLTRDTTRNDSNEQHFHITIVKGTNPVSSWTLDYGDGSKITKGTGAVNKDIKHLYEKEGTFTVELKAVDSKKTEQKATLSVTVKAQKEEAGTKTTETTEKNTTQLTSQTKTPIITVDLSVVGIKVDKKITVGKEAAITVGIKNDSDQSFDSVVVDLYAGSKKIGSETTALTAGQSANPAFKYTPDKAGTCTFRARINIPKGFKDTNSKNNTLTETVEIK
jgi:hypothetical protein